MKQLPKIDENGYFIGVSIADESPREPGKYLIPHDAIDASIPTPKDGMVARWNGSDWVYENEPKEKPRQPYPSWTFNEDIWEWVAPVEKTDPEATWDELEKKWLTPLEVLSNEVRDERNQLLRDSDWITLKSYSQGVPVPQEWVDYQQALRDIPQQKGFPHDVDWPVKPNS